MANSLTVFPERLTVFPERAGHPTLPVNIRPDISVVTQYDYATGKTKRVPGAPKYLPVCGHTSYLEAEWWRNMVVHWAATGIVSFENLPNAHLVWVVGQICPPESEIWRKWRLGFSYAYGVVLGHLQVKPGEQDISGMAMGLLKEINDWWPNSSEGFGAFRIKERFPQL